LKRWHEVGSSSDTLESVALVDRDVIGLQAFDEVLRLGFRGVMSVALHPNV